MLPGMDGYQLAQRLQARPESIEMTLIAVTGLGDKASRRSAKEAGFIHHLLKPMVYDELREILAAVAAKKKLSRR